MRGVQSSSCMRLADDMVYRVSVRHVRDSADANGERDWTDCTNATVHARRHVSRSPRPKDRLGVGLVYHIYMWGGAQ